MAQRLHPGCTGRRVGRQQVGSLCGVQAKSCGARLRGALHCHGGHAHTLCQTNHLAVQAARAPSATSRARPLVVKELEPRDTVGTGRVENRPGLPPSLGKEPRDAGEGADKHRLPGPDGGRKDPRGPISTPRLPDCWRSFSWRMPLCHPRAGEAYPEAGGHFSEECAKHFSGNVTGLSGSRRRSPTRREPPPSVWAQSPTPSSDGVQQAMPTLPWSRNADSPAFFQFVRSPVGRGSPILSQLQLQMSLSEAARGRRRL